MICNVPLASLDYHSNSHRKIAGAALAGGGLGGSLLAPAASLAGAGGPSGGMQVEPPPPNELATQMQMALSTPFPGIQGASPTDSWCSIAYYELNNRVGETFKAFKSRCAHTIHHTRT